MTRSPPAPLSIPNMPLKGAALPAIESLDGSTAAPRPTVQLPVQRLSSRVQATIAVTVRLDERRYERMKTWGTVRRVTNQEIIVAALDGFFGLSDEAREEAIASPRK